MVRKVNKQNWKDEAYEHKSTITSSRIVVFGRIRYTEKSLYQSIYFDPWKAGLAFITKLVKLILKLSLSVV